MARFSMGPFGPYLSEKEYDEIHGPGAGRQRIEAKKTQGTVIAIIGIIILIACLVVLVPLFWNAIFDPYRNYRH